MNKNACLRPMPHELPKGLETRAERINNFSRLYKKMCGTAEEIQQLWPTVWREGNDCCEKGKYENGLSNKLRLEGLKKEERKELLSRNIWIPCDLELRTRSLSKSNNILNRNMTYVLQDLRDYLMNKRMGDKVKEYFMGDEINYALTLMFVMKERFNKRWDFRHEGWVKIKFLS
jgi:hypothetical protein